MRRAARSAPAAPAASPSSRLAQLLDLIAQRRGASRSRGSPPRAFICALRAGDVRIELGLRPERCPRLARSATRRVVALVDARHHVVDRLDDRLRRDAVLLVVGLPASRGGARSRRSPCCIESVIVSAYMMTRPLTLRAARPTSGSASPPSAGSLPCRRRGSPPATLPAGPALRAAG